MASYSPSASSGTVTVRRTRSVPDHCVVGLGGGAIPREMRHYFPEVLIDVVEIDPEIAKVAERFFRFQTDAKLTVHIADGRMFIKKLLRRKTVPKYDLIILDAFNSEYIPFHLMTKEFLEQVRGVLADDGVVVANVFRTNRLFDAELKTFLAVFGRCQAFCGVRSTNAMLVSGGRACKPLARKEAGQRASRLQRKHLFAFDLRVVASRLRLHIRPAAAAKVLTDDCAPVNRLRWQSTSGSSSRTKRRRLSGDGTRGSRIRKTPETIAARAYHVADFCDTRWFEERHKQYGSVMSLDLVCRGCAAQIRQSLLWRQHTISRHSFSAVNGLAYIGVGGCPLDISNRLARQIAKNEPAVGMWIDLCDPGVAQIAALAGYDWIMIDNEHNPFTESQVQGMIHSVSRFDMQTIVRVRANNEAHVKWVLDAGAGGIMIPGLRSLAEAEHAVHISKYHPLGCRGYGPLRASGFWTQHDQYKESANNDILLICQIEHKDALDDIDAICRLQAIDALWIGPTDLAQSMGHVAEPQAPEVQEAMGKIIDAANRHGKPWGIPTVLVEDFDAYVQRGGTVMVLGSDTRLLYNGATALTAHVRERRESTS